MTINISEQSRFNIIDTPILAPGKCAICGATGGDSRKFIDWGMQLDWFGAVYFCTHCVAEIAVASGFVPVAKFNSLHDNLRKIQIEVDQLRAKYGPFEEAIKNVMDSPDPGFGMVLHPSGIQHTDVEVYKSNESDNSESARGAEASNESDNVERSDDFFDDSDFDRD